MKNVRFIVLDVETTGLSPRNGDRIIEIGALAIERRIIKEEFHTLINIDRTISRQAQEIHGITQAMLAGKPKPEEVMPEFAEFIRDSVLIAHNAKFDMGFVRHEFRKQRLSLMFCMGSLRLEPTMIFMILQGIIKVKQYFRPSFLPVPAITA